MGYNFCWSAMLRISVIIIAVNRRKYLLQAIKSAVNQTLDRSHYEIIVAKNFNDEEIDDFIEKNNVKSIFYDRVNPKSGYIDQGAFYSLAIEQASGDVLCFLDDDDYFVQEKLEKVYRVFDRNEKVVYYHNRQIFIDDSGNRIKKRRKGPDYNSSSISVRKEIIDPAKLIKVEFSADTFLYLSALEYGGKILLGKDLLTVVRVHSSQSNPDSEMKFYQWYMLLYQQYEGYMQMFHSREAVSHTKCLIFVWSVTLFSINKKIKPKYFWTFLWHHSSGRAIPIFEYIVTLVLGDYARKMIHKHRFS